MRNLGIIMVEKTLIDQIEAVCVKELGVGSSVIIDQKLTELGLNRDSFKKKDYAEFMNKLMEEYIKLLGEHVKYLESEIQKQI